MNTPNAESQVHFVYCDHVPEFAPDIATELTKIDSSAIAFEAAGGTPSLRTEYQAACNALQNSASGPFAEIVRTAIATALDELSGVAYIPAVLARMPRTNTPIHLVDMPNTDKDWPVVQQGGAALLTYERAAVSLTPNSALRLIQTHAIKDIAQGVALRDPKTALQLEAIAGPPAEQSVKQISFVGGMGHIGIEGILNHNGYRTSSTIAGGMKLTPFVKLVRAQAQDPMNPMDPHELDRTLLGTIISKRYASLVGDVSLQTAQNLRMAVIDRLDDATVVGSLDEIDKIKQSPESAEQRQLHIDQFALDITSATITKSMVELLTITDT